MGTSTEERLRKLREKQTSISAEIKKLEQEKARELRKIQEKKERLIGQAIAACLEKKESVRIENEGDVLNLLDRYVKRKADRDILGLKPLVVENQSTTAEKKNEEKESIPAPESEAEHHRTVTPSIAA